jgi:hypothetical protein
MNFIRLRMRWRHNAQKAGNLGLYYNETSSAYPDVSFIVSDVQADESACRAGIVARQAQMAAAHL